MLSLNTHMMGAVMGQVVPRQAARGLMWLTLGRDCAGAEEPWVKPVYDGAFKRASDDERALALAYLEDWHKGRFQENLWPL